MEAHVYSYILKYIILFVRSTLLNHRWLHNGNGVSWSIFPLTGQAYVDATLRAGKLFMISGSVYCFAVLGLDSNSSFVFSDDKDALAKGRDALKIKEMRKDNDSRVIREVFKETPLGGPPTFDKSAVALISKRTYETLEDVSTVILICVGIILT